MSVSTISALARSMRLPFLLLTPLCVLLGLGSALRNEAQPGMLDFWLLLLGALAAHISVNTLNEYQDFKSGLDARTTRTPFSGGSGVLPEHPEFAGAVLRLALGSLALCCVIGLYFVWQKGWGLLPLGLLGVVVVVFYTRWLNRFPQWCLIAPGLAFGPLMVMGSEYVLTGHYSFLAFVVSMVPFFLVNNLLLLNQYPDVEADRAVGRRTFPIVFGTKRSTVVYVVFVFGVMYVLGIGVAVAVLPPLAMAAMLPLLAAVYALVGGFKYGDQPERLGPYLTANMLAAVFTNLVLMLALLFG